MAHKTREAWLTEATKRLDKMFFDGAGHEMPKTRVSCGFPLGASKAIGQCFGIEGSADNTYEMFISPRLDEPVTVLSVLIHEMIHACVGIEAGHRGPFKKLALEIGLTGKMTATRVAEGTDLHAKLLTLHGKLGDYPHSALEPRRLKKQRKSNWIRYMSTNEESYRVVANILKIEEHGAPLDPWGDPMVPTE